jgi:hypothetical protein
MKLWDNVRIGSIITGYQNNLYIITKFSCSHIPMRANSKLYLNHLDFFKILMIHHDDLFIIEEDCLQLYQYYA